MLSYFKCYNVKQLPKGVNILLGQPVQEDETLVGKLTRYILQVSYVVSTTSSFPLIAFNKVSPLSLPWYFLQKRRENKFCTVAICKFQCQWKDHATFTAVSLIREKKRSPNIISFNCAWSADCFCFCFVLFYYYLTLFYRQTQLHQEVASGPTKYA